MFWVLEFLLPEPHYGDPPHLLRLILVLVVHWEAFLWALEALFCSFSYQTCQTKKRKIVSMQNLKTMQNPSKFNNTTFFSGKKEIILRWKQKKSFKNLVNGSWSNGNDVWQRWYMWQISFQMLNVLCGKTVISGSFLLSTTYDILRLNFVTANNTMSTSTYQWLHIVKIFCKTYISSYMTSLGA